MKNKGQAEVSEKKEKGIRSYGFVMFIIGSIFVFVSFFNIIELSQNTDIAVSVAGVFLEIFGLIIILFSQN